MIYHLALPENLKNDFDNESLTASSLSIEGFIHCSTEEQLAGVLERYFDGINQVCLFYIDEKKLTSELKYELATNDELFPHVFGTINKASILDCKELNRNHKGFFDLPF